MYASQIMDKLDGYLRTMKQCGRQPSCVVLTQKQFNKLENHYKSKFKDKDERDAFRLNDYRGYAIKIQDH